MGLRRLCLGDGNAVCLAMANLAPVAAALGVCVVLLGKVEDDVVPDRLESEDQSTFRMLVTGVRAVCDHSLITQQDPVLTVYSDMAAAMLERLVS
eukprot:s3490_g14.t1